MFLDVLSAQFRRRASRADIAFNPGFAGAYDFSRQPDFGALMRQFLDGLPEHGLIMCHPGFVDEILVSLDPLTTQREHEHAFLGGEHFPAPVGREQSYIGLISRPTAGRLCRIHKFNFAQHYLRHKAAPTSPPRFDAKERKP